MQFRHQASQASLTCQSIRVYFLKCKLKCCHYIKLSYLSLEKSHKFCPIMFEKRLSSKMQLGMLYLLNRKISAYALFTAMNRIIHHTYLMTEVMFFYITVRVKIYSFHSRQSMSKREWQSKKAKNLEWLISHTGCTRSKTTVLAEFCYTFVILLFGSETVLKTSKISIANLDEFRYAHHFNKKMLGRC